MLRKPMGRTIVIAALSLLRCAASPPDWGDGDSGYTLTYRFSAKESEKYESKTMQHITMEMAGAVMEMDIEYTLSCSVLESGRQKDGNRILGVTVERLEGRLRGVQGQGPIDAESLTGRRFGMVMTPRGKIVRFLDIDTLPRVNLGPMAGGEQSVSYFFNNLFPMLPDTPVRPDDTWTTSSDETVPENPEESEISTVTTSKLVEAGSGIDPAHLRMETRSRGSLSRSGERMGMHIRFEADLETESAWIFDYRQGCLISLEGENVIEGSVAMSGQVTQTMPMLIEGTTTTRRLAD